MKVLTFRLGQFVITALALTVLFRYALGGCIENGYWNLIWLCTVTYFCLMFLAGRYFGKKDSAENGIHDIGFRFHLVTYVVCIGMQYLSYYIGWNTGSMRGMNITALCWGIGLFIHFIFYLLAQKQAIKGYDKDGLFQ